MGYVALVVRGPRSAWPEAARGPSESIPQAVLAMEYIAPPAIILRKGLIEVGALTSSMLRETVMLTKYTTKARWPSVRWGLGCPWRGHPTILARCFSNPHPQPTWPRRLTQALPTAPQGKTYPHLAEHVAEFLVATLFSTSLLALDSKRFRCGPSAVQSLAVHGGTTWGAWVRNWCGCCWAFQRGSHELSCLIGTPAAHQ